MPASTTAVTKLKSNILSGHERISFLQNHIAQCESGGCSQKRKEDALKTKPRLCNR